MVNEDGLSTIEHRRRGIGNANTLLERNRAGVFRVHGIVEEKDLRKLEGRRG